MRDKLTLCDFPLSLLPSHHEKRENDLLPDQSGSALASLGVFAFPRVANPRKGRIRPAANLQDACVVVTTPHYSGERQLFCG